MYLVFITFRFVSARRMISTILFGCVSGAQSSFAPIYTKNRKSVACDLAKKSCSSIIAPKASNKKYSFCLIWIFMLLCRCQQNPIPITLNNARNQYEFDKYHIERTFDRLYILYTYYINRRANASQFCCWWIFDERTWSHKTSLWI